jgi:hypothetical protein
MKSLEAVLRSLAAAARSLRLYPAASPIPLQSVAAVRDALDAHFETGSDPLCIALARDGFSVEGTSVGSHLPGARDLSDELRARGVAEVDIAGEITGEELLTFLSVIARPVDEVRAEGGVAALAAAGGVEHLRIAEVRLAVVEQALDAEETDALLLALSDDPGDLAAWYAAASAGDSAAFEAELESLVRSAGPEGEGRLVRSLGTTFKSQPPTGQDALLSLAMKPGLTRDFVGSMFEGFDATQIAGSILSGTFGKNMLALSNALSNLPLEDAASEVRAEVQAMLARTGHTSSETDFLDHMLEVRANREPEPPLVDADRTYNAVLAAATLSDDDVARARDAVAASGRDISAAGVRTMLAILDDQTDFERYCKSAENLAATVPSLIEQGNLGLAARVLSELSGRQTHNAGPWPELCQRLEAALEVAAGERSMNALVKAVAADPARTDEAREIVRYAGDSAGPSLVVAAIAQKDAGIAVAEELLGRRVIDLLNAAAPDTSWHLVGPVARRLTAEGDPRSVATVEALLARPDEQSRREVVSALASVGGPVANRLLANALRDPRPETVATAARAIARSGEPGSAALLAARLGELDVDRGDYAQAKELIGALARTPGPEADEALATLGSRRAFIKRGHFADIQALVAEAQRARKGGIAQ